MSRQENLFRPEFRHVLTYMASYSVLYVQVQTHGNICYPVCCRYGAGCGVVCGVWCGGKSSGTIMGPLCRTNWTCSQNSTEFRLCVSVILGESHRKRTANVRVT